MQISNENIFVNDISSLDERLVLLEQMSKIKVLFKKHLILLLA